MAWLEDFLTRYPELALFLVIAVGYRIGSVRFGNFSLGPVTGSLFAGLLLGQFAEVPVSGMAKSFLFLLFLFGIGYSVGPQFLQALRQDGLKSVLLALVCTTTGLGAALVVAKFLGLDAGFAAGLLSGALTQSPAMGTATEAVNSLALPEAERARLVAHVAVADAVCYVFGAVGAIWFCSVAGPRILKVDLVAESRTLEAKFGIERTQPGVVSGYRELASRAYVIAPDVAIVGMTVGQAEARAAEHRLFILRLRRAGALIDARPDLILEAGDVIAVVGRTKSVIEVLGPRAAEVEDRELVDIPFLVADILLTAKEVSGRTIEDIASDELSHGLYLREIRRGGQRLPLAPGIVLERGDLLSLAGPVPVVERAARQIGPVVAPSNTTDFVVLGLAIFLGGVAGTLMKFSIGGISVSLGTSIGALLAGLIVGHLRTRNPLFGRIPDGAVSLMTALGLAAFVAMTGLHAGPVFLPALQEAGLGLLVGGAVVTLVPLVVGLLFGRYVLRMNPVLLLGGLAGSLTMTAAMAAVQTRADSPVAVLGYTPAYPVAQILLTVWGTIIVVLMAP